MLVPSAPPKDGQPIRSWKWFGMLVKSWIDISFGTRAHLAAKISIIECFAIIKALSLHLPGHSNVPLSKALHDRPPRLEELTCVALLELKPRTSITSVLLSSPLRYSWIFAGSQMQSTNQGTSLLSLHLFRFRDEGVCFCIFSNLLHLLLPGVVLIAATFSTSRI